MELPDKIDLSLSQLTELVKAQLTKGLGAEHMIHQLVLRGWPEVTARQFVLHTAQSIATETGITAAEAEERRQGMRGGLKRVVSGAIMLMIALAIAALGLALAQTGSGFFIFAPGVILGAFAIVFLITGLEGWFINHQ